MKPSQVVVLIAGGAAGDSCAPGGGQGFLTQRRPDGSSAPFQIPTGQVLVATQVTVSLFDGSVTSANRSFLVGLSAGGPVPPLALAYFVVPLDASGFGAGAQEFSPGLVVASGQTVCLWPGAVAGGVLNATLGGYLTKDK